MFEYINGGIVDLTPTYVVIDVHGIGYFVNISLTTYSALMGKEMYKVFIHQVVREDANILYGFISSSERQIFRHLISVSGIGANTAIMMLSAYSPVELQSAIVGEDVNLLKGIKGIGAKTAQRVIIELKDKLTKIDGFECQNLPSLENNIKEEALSAMIMLGFNKKAVDKILDKLLKESSSYSVEELIKQALKHF